MPPNRWSVIFHDWPFVSGLEHTGTMRAAGTVAADLVAHVADLYQGTAPDDSVPFGLRDLDARTGSLKRGELIVMAGRPGMGKTTVGGTIALNAGKRGHGVAFFSLEMAARPVMAKMTADYLFSEIGRPLTVNRILRADITEDDFELMTDAARAIEALPLIIDDAPRATVGEITAKVRSAQKRFARNGKKLDLVIIDYLKFLRATDRYLGQRHYEVGEITAGLKMLAKELGVAVLLLAQLNRKTEDRPDRRPQLADLRESGDLEADADVVMLLFREGYYLQSDPAIGTDPIKTARFEEVANTLEIIIAKQRMGPVCTVQTYINLECSAVADAAASRLLADVNVSARVAELKAEAAQGTVATAREVLEELTRIAFANMKSYVADDDTTKPVCELTDAQASIIQERIVEHYAEGDGDGQRVVTKVKFKLCDKLGALRDLGRHHKLFTDKTEFAGKDGAPLTATINLLGCPEMPQGGQS